MERLKTEAEKLFANDFGWELSVQSLFDQARECVCIINTEGFVKYWNQGGEKLYGIKPEDIRNKSIWDYFPNALGPMALKDKTTLCRMETHAESGGTVLVSATPIIVNKVVRGAITIDYDVGEMGPSCASTYRALSCGGGEESSSCGGRVCNEVLRFGDILYKSAEFGELTALARKISTTDATVLITGESGTGKELFSKAIHMESERRNGPYIIIDCSTISENLIESELFGYESGAFTGALKSGKPGKFELANGGTVFLDEIGELSLEMQAKLLRVLESKTFYRINGTRPISTDVRVIAATNRSIEQMVQEETFRLDLYYRLNVFSLCIPPLRERKDDILVLIYHYLEYYAKINRKRIRHIAPQVICVLKNYAWPGNIRELRNIIERLVVLSDDGTITLEDTSFMVDVFCEPKEEPDSPCVNTLEEVASISLEVERETIRKALESADNNMARAAKILKIPRTTLYYKLEKLQMETPKGKRGRPSGGKGESS